MDTIEYNYIRNHNKLYNKSLCNIKYEIPNIQRLIMDDHVSSIYNSELNYYNTHNSYLLLGCIALAKDVKTNIEYLIDGQNRLTAYKKLQIDYPDREILLTYDYFECDGIDNINKLYKLINNTRPNAISKLQIDDYKIINDFVKLFQTNFKDYIKVSALPQKPHINITNLTDHLTLVINNIISLHKINTGSDLYNLVISLNKFYSDISLNNIEKFKIWKVKNYEVLINKINSNYSVRLYLGMYDMTSWLSILENYKASDWNNITHYNHSNREKICKTVRTEVWNSLSRKSNCYCCNCEIDYDTFECGHIISVFKGGLTTKDNLKPICRNCNSDMKTEDMNVYKNKLLSQNNNL